MPFSGLVIRVRHRHAMARFIGAGRRWFLPLFDTGGEM